jgi:hypothetical protein
LRVVIHPCRFFFKLVRRLNHKLDEIAVRSARGVAPPQIGTEPKNGGLPGLGGVIVVHTYITLVVVRSCKAANARLRSRSQAALPRQNAIAQRNFYPTLSVNRGRRPSPLINVVADLTDGPGYHFLALEQCKPAICNGAIDQRWAAQRPKMLDLPTLGRPTMARVSGMASCPYRRATNSAPSV